MRLKPSIELISKTAIIFALFASIQTAALAQTSTAFPRLEPDPKALEFHSLGQRPSGYTWMELAQISLWASGDTSAANLERIRETVNAINNSGELPASGRERAEFILTFLHRNILRTYSAFQTRVDTVFANGRFNCVSSAVLYMILCEAVGINTSGVVTRDHAFVTVHIGGENIDVETTNRFGFDPGNRREFHDQFGRLTGFAYVPQQNYRDRQTISNIELVSLILKNRIADHERQNRYAEAVPVAIDRAALLLGNSLFATSAAGSSEALFESPRRDLMDRLFNYGGWLLRANREEDSLRWAAAASSMYPDSNRWEDFVTTAVNNRIVRFLRSNRVTDARDFLENQKTAITDTAYTHFNVILIDAEILREANQIRTVADGDAVAASIERERANGTIEERRANELLTFTILRTAELLCAAPARDWRAAIEYLEDAIERFGANRELEQTLRNYRTNLAADFHNRFAAEWNRRNYEEAERILNEGLAEFPNDRRLLANRDIVNRSRQN